MGENSYEHYSPSLLAETLTPAMIKALHVAAATGYGVHPATGGPSTVAGLRRRGLVELRGSGHYLTALGRRVAYAAGVDVKLLDDLHAEVNADSRQRAERTAPCTCEPYPLFGHEDRCRHEGCGPTQEQPSRRHGDVIPTPPPIKPGDLVTVPSRDGRVWLVESITEGTEADSITRPWATLTRGPAEERSYTTSFVHYLQHADCSTALLDGLPIDEAAGRIVARAKYEVLRDLLAQFAELDGSDRITVSLLRFETDHVATRHHTRKPWAP